MDDDILRSDCRQRTTASKGPAHQKTVIIDSDDGEHTTDSEPESVPISPVVSPSRVTEQKSEPTQKVSSSSEPVGRPLYTSSSITDKKSKWIPPAAAGSSNNPMKYVSVKSPPQCLRLGLSRLARVKPLHPSATSS
ncbi:R51A1 protein, partial [Brachypteracias leptosomus]|nr:R51A1 protein [Brachypteracias leptosomus]